MSLPRHAISLITRIRPWRGGQWRYLLEQSRHYTASGTSNIPDEVHVRAAAEWLTRAQDATGNDGIAGRYLVGKGWTKPYPKTTGDLVPTFLALAEHFGAEHFGADDFRRRAKACVGFLLPLQMASGAFPAGEMDGGRPTPSAFNTAQIISGLIAWQRAGGGEESLLAANRAADWLVGIQDEDGAWRRHFLGGLASTHDAYLACWLAELGALTGNSRYLGAARRNLDWVLSRQSPASHWINLMGYDKAQQQKGEALTHSIGYTLMGALKTARILGDQDAAGRIREAAKAPARLVADLGHLPAVLDHHWQPKAPHTCLTGNAQMAELWLTLHDMAADRLLLDAARAVLNIVKQSQSLDNPDPDRRGGIAGSNPIWGEYIFMALPNWAAKFFIDAMLLLKRLPTALS